MGAWVRALGGWLERLPAMLGSYYEPLVRLAWAGAVALTLRWYWGVMLSLFGAARWLRPDFMGVAMNDALWALGHFVSMLLGGAFALAVVYVLTREVWRRGSETKVVIPPGLDLEREMALCRKQGRPFVDCGTFDLLEKHWESTPTTLMSRAKDLRVLLTVGSLGWWSLLLRVWSGPFQPLHVTAVTVTPGLAMGIILVAAIAFVVAKTLMRVAKALMDLFFVWVTPWIGRTDDLARRLLQRLLHRTPRQTSLEG